ncbi:MAG TPA: hypothetical protein DCG39_03110 [Opitutae bacterium]|nr:hypothetical protein [Opitutae bacterium]
MTDEEFQIPREVPVMTLRDCVLFPKAMMPLRIFEQRYRLMLEDVLRGDRMFALVGARPEEEQHEIPYDIATVGYIRVSKKNPDGTSFLLLQGIERVRICSISSEDPYRIIEVEPIETHVDESALAMRAELTLQLERNRKLGGEVTDEILDFLHPIEDDVAFVDLAAYSLCKQTLRKQAMLEVATLSQRANMLLEDLLLENEKLSLLKEALGDLPDEGFDSN